MFLLATMLMQTPTISVHGQQMEELPSILRSQPARPLTVKLSGTVRLSKPLEFGAELSGVTLVGDGKVVISGGTPIKGWKKTGSLWRAKLPFHAKNVRQLYANNKVVYATGAGDGTTTNGNWRQFKDFAKPEDRGLAWNAGHDQMKVASDGNDIRLLAKPGAEILVTHFWVTSRLGVSKIDSGTGIVTFDRKSVWKMADDGWDPSAAPAFYRIENAQDPAPGENRFRFDPTDNTLTTGFQPRNALVGSFPTLVNVTGASNFTFTGLQFGHTEYIFPDESAGDWQGGHSIPAAVTLHNCKKAKITGNQFKNLGAWAVELKGAESTENEISQNKMHDLGAGGIKINNGVSKSLIEENDIRNGGNVIMAACGIWVGLSGDNVINRNRIDQMRYTGISVGWDWGFKDTEAKNNRVSNNRITNIGSGQLSDMGGIYTLGKQPGSIIINNSIENVVSRKYGGWGIYLDEGTTNMTVENNLVRRTRSGGFHIHYGRDNHIKNNIFFDSETDGVLIRSRDDQQGAITFENNVVVSNRPEIPVVIANWLSRDVTMTGNIFWQPNAKPDSPLPFGADQSNKWLEPNLDKHGLPRLTGWSGIDLSLLPK